MNMQANRDNFEPDAEVMDGWRVELPSGAMHPVLFTVTNHTQRVHVVGGFFRDFPLPPTIVARVDVAPGLTVKGTDTSVRWALAALVSEAASKAWRVWLLAPGELSRAELARVHALPAPPPVEVLSEAELAHLALVGCDDPMLRAAVTRLREALARESAARRSYEEGITWDTTCTGCARLLTQLAALDGRIAGNGPEDAEVPSEVE